MRGRLGLPPERKHLNRNTPAYAGKTQKIFNLSQIKKKHPRVCGEDSAIPNPTYRERETPPRMRGRRGGRESLPECSRNTPAYAGKTLMVMEMENKLKKHPRVCGED